MSLNTYISKSNELDTDENGAQRITPAGRSWILSGSDGDLHYLDCAATGASIICDSSELAVQFAEGGAAWPPRPKPPAMASSMQFGKR